MRCGIRSVTMDDVCKEMRISKKTLYQYVHDKTDLVNQTMRSEIEKDEEEITRLIQGGHNAIDEIHTHQTTRTSFNQKTEPF